MTSVLPYDPHPYLHEGMQVEVIRGPLLRGPGDPVAEREASLPGIGCAVDPTGRGGRDRFQRCGAGLMREDQPSVDASEGGLADGLHDM